MRFSLVAGWCVPNRWRLYSWPHLAAAIDTTLYIIFFKNILWSIRKLSQLFNIKLSFMNLWSVRRHALVTRLNSQETSGLLSIKQVLTYFSSKYYINLCGRTRATHFHFILYYIDDAVAFLFHYLHYKHIIFKYNQSSRYVKMSWLSRNV